MKDIKEIKTDFQRAFAEASTIPGLAVTDIIEIAIAVLQEYGRYQRGEAANTARNNGNGFNRNGKQPASEKQKGALDKFNIEYDENITKAEASELLDKAIAEAKKRKGRVSPAFSSY